jgi:hypothetical protein
MRAVKDNPAARTRHLLQLHLAASAMAIPKTQSSPSPLTLDFPAHRKTIPQAIVQKLARLTCYLQSDISGLE